MRKNIKNIVVILLSMGASSVLAKPLAGLWMANIEVDKVNEVHSASIDVDTPKAVKYPFNLQFIFHMDRAGNTKLLKEVYVMQTKGVETKKRVLITDERRLSDFEGIIRKGDNKLVPVRLSSPSIDFESAQSEIDLVGKIDSSNGSSIIGNAIIHDKLHPTNPFRHQFHPNHKEGRTITRSFKITVQAPSIPAGEGNTPSNIGRTKLYAEYEETMLGLHKVALKVSGSAILTQVSRVDKLNPSITGE